MKDGVKTHYAIMKDGVCIEVVGAMYAAQIELRRHPGATLFVCEW